MSTCRVPADCSPQIFEGGAGWSAGIKEETCVFDPSRLTVLRRTVWNTDRTEVNRVQWLFQEDEDRLYVHGDDRFGAWVPYSRRLCILIESHHLIYSEAAKRGRPKFLLTLESGHKRFNLHTGLQYEIDLERLIQKNVMTGFERKLLRRDPGAANVSPPNSTVRKDSQQGAAPREASNSVSAVGAAASARPQSASPTPPSPVRHYATQSASQTPQSTGDDSGSTSAGKSSCCIAM